MDLTRFQVFILLTIKDNNGINLSGLSSQLMVDSSNLDKNLKMLIESGFIVVYDNTRPQQYYLNMELYKKWIKN